MTIEPDLPEYGDTVYIEGLDTYGKAVGLIGGLFAIDLGPRPYLMVEPFTLTSTPDGWEVLFFTG